MMQHRPPTMIALASHSPEPAVAAMNEAFAKAMETLLIWCKGALPVK